MDTQNKDYTGSSKSSSNAVSTSSSQGKSGGSSYKESSRIKTSSSDSGTKSTEVKKTEIKQSYSGVLEPEKSQSYKSSGSDSSYSSQQSASYSGSRNKQSDSSNFQSKPQSSSSTSQNKSGSASSSASGSSQGKQDSNSKSSSHSLKGGIENVLQGSLGGSKDKSAENTDRNEQNGNISILNELYQNAEMGKQAIGSIIPKITNENLKKEIVSCYENYDKMSSQTASEIIKLGDRPREKNPFKKAVLWGTINVSTLVDDSPSNIADIMIKGSHNSVSSITKALNQNSGSLDSNVKSLADKFIQNQQDTISNLQKFL